MLVFFRNNIVTHNVLSCDTSWLIKDSNVEPMQGINKKENVSLLSRNNILALAILRNSKVKLVILWYHFSSTVLFRDDSRILQEALLLLDS